MARCVWLAGPEDLGAVASLLAEFRDWWGKSEPTDEGIRDTVEQLVETRRRTSCWPRPTAQTLRPGSASSATA